MDIAIISSYPTEGCGVSKYTKELINGLERNQVNVLSHRIFFYKQKLRSIFLLIKIICDILSQKPEIVHIQYTPTICGPFIIPFLFLLKFFGSAKIIVTAHEKPGGYLRHIKNKRIGKAFLLYEKNIFRLANKVLVHTTEHKKKLIDRYDTPIEKIEIIPHGISKGSTVTNNQIQEIKEKYNLKNGKIITFFGSIRPNKGVEYLILAFSKVIKRKNNLILLIAGSAPKIWSEYLNSLKNLSITLDIADYIRFTGFIDDRNIPAILQTSEIVVLPYIQITQSGVLHREVIPYAKPVIISDVGGIAETVKKYHIGIVVPPKDVISLENAILEILNNYKKCNKYIENQKRVRKQYSWINIARMHVKIYRGEKYEHF